MGGAIDKRSSVIVNCSACLHESPSPLLVGQNEWPMNIYYMVQGDGGCSAVLSVVTIPHAIHQILCSPSDVTPPECRPLQ